MNNCHPYKNQLWFFVFAEMYGLFTADRGEMRNRMHYDR